MGWYCSQSYLILFEGCGVLVGLIFGSEIQSVALVNVGSNRIANEWNLHITLITSAHPRSPALIYQSNFSMHLPPSSQRHDNSSQLSRYSSMERQSSFSRRTLAYFSAQRLILINPPTQFHPANADQRTRHVNPYFMLSVGLSGMGEHWPVTSQATHWWRTGIGTNNLSKPQNAHYQQ